MPDKDTREAPKCASKPTTAAELLAWGAAEDRARQADLARIASTEDFNDAKAAANRRRRAAGLTRNEAAHWIKEAQIAKRRAGGS